MATFNKDDFVKFNQWVGYVEQVYHSPDGETIYKIMWGKNLLLQGGQPDIVWRYLDKLEPATQGEFVSHLTVLLNDVTIEYKKFCEGFGNHSDSERIIN